MPFLDLVWYHVV